ncbi:PAS domain S-box-containing protein [Natrinema salaciae]|uniref:histidine kinase n=2 Tax=Natrinema salaciae TaxID=1186196 RepID=A0A1H9MS39_9EURY|nr:PAS domain S-box-containing protein [Natrinema salaciae]
MRAVSGRYSIVLLGGLLIVLAAALAYTLTSRNAPPFDIFIAFSLSAGSGAILIYSSSQLPDTDIDPRYYPVIGVWCVGSVVVTATTLWLYHVQPAAGNLTDPPRVILNLASLGGIAGYAIGFHDSRARTRASELERRNTELGRARENLEEYERIVETVDDGVYVLDEARRFQRVNDAFVSMTHFDRSELLGTYASAVFGTNFEDIDAEARHQFESGETDVASFEEEIYTAEDEAITVESRLRQFPVEGGWGRVGVVRDITERKRMEQELRESERRFRQLAEHLDQVVWMTTADQQELLYVNPAYEEVWGVDREDLYENATAWAETIHPDDRERVLEEFHKQVQDRHEAEYRIVRPDGEVRWIHDRATPIYDQNGDAYRIVGDANDVTERKKREQQLERFERIVETVNDGVYATDGDGHIVFVNDAFVSMSQHTREELLGAHGSVFFGERFVDTDEEEWCELIDGERDSVEFETEIIGPDVEVRVVHNRFVPLEIDDEMGRVGVTRDITELKEYQRKLEESNERLEQFAYVASHDLQEPLRMVSSYLQLLEGRYADELDQDAEEFIEFAVDGAERMREMIEDLLAYSRINTEAAPLEPTDCGAVIENALRNLERQIEENDAKIDIGSLPTVPIDQNQLEQVFQNLVSNAIKYHGDDPPEIEISAERDGGKWVFQVADNGIGMDPEQTDRIFDVFERLHTAEEHSGTGIGLALCTEIIDRHGGDIWVESEPGDGSTFYFTIPDANRSRDPGDQSTGQTTTAEGIDD